MTKKTKNQIDKDEAQRALTPEELAELQELNRLHKAYAFVATLVSKNTLLVENGQEEAKKIKVIAELIEREKQGFMAVILAKKGFAQDAQVSVNIVTGEITKVVPPSEAAA